MPAMSWWKRIYVGKTSLNTMTYLFLHTSSLSEMENVLVGSIPYLASFMKPLMDKVDPEVVCFGCVLYEVCMGTIVESE